MKKTLVLGASPNPSRVSYQAVQRLKDQNHQVLPVGIRSGEIAGETILTDLPQESVDTVTLYLGPARQPEYYNYVIGLKPERIIFNPGTENPEFYEKAEAAGIEVVKNCTLVMLAVGSYTTIKVY